MKTKATLGTAFFAVCALSLHAQKNDMSRVDSDYLQRGMVRREMHIPDILGYKTLKCDFHIHTVFSDGVVWPTVRVDEAWREGLDAIAITEHVEYWPTKDKWLDTKDANASYDIALPRAAQLDMILIRGAEITRRNPDVGHYNALFLSDCNPLRMDRGTEPEKAIEAALKQGAFIFWNHPGWDQGKTTDTTQFFSRQREMVARGMIHGVEVFNTANYYPVMIRECLDNNLAMLCNTDIHDLISESYYIERDHRPVTLVLAEERSGEAIREALFSRRTVLWFNHQLIGKEEYLKAFFDAAVTARLKYTGAWGGNMWEVTNTSDVPFLMEIDHRMTTIPAASTVLVVADREAVQLTGEVKNLICGPFTHPTVTIRKTEK